MSAQPSDKDRDERYAKVRERVRRIAAAITAGTELMVHERSCELVITNPRLPERGQVHIEYADGYVCWERPAWEHWGVLEGTDFDPGEPVRTSRIVATLIPPPEPVLPALPGPDESRTAPDS